MSSTLINEIERVLSRQAIPSVAVVKSNLNNVLQHYRKHYRRPLVVSLAATVYHLTAEMKDIDMSYPIWLVVSLNTTIGYADCNDCSAPDNNRLSVDLGVQMFVWCCCRPNYLSGWWTKNGKDLQYGPISNWNTVDGLVDIDHGSYSLKRYNLNGAPFRIVYFSVNNLLKIN